MKALAVFPGERGIRLIDRPEPAIEAPTQVLLRVLEVGICGTDKEIVAFEYGTPPEGEGHLVLGHECLAEVVETGPAVAAVSPGDLVVPTVRRPCSDPACRACAAGRQDFCSTGMFRERGIQGAHGFMAERVVEEEQFLTRLDPGLREVGVLVEPLTIAEKAAEQARLVQQRLPWLRDLAREDPGAGHEALVLGAGPVGLLGAMVLRRAGLGVTVYSKTSPGDPRQGVVAAIGARFVSADEVSAEDLVRGLGQTLDLVYEAVGASALAFEVLQALGPNGIFIFTGVPGRKAPVPIDTDRMMGNLVLKNQVILGTVNAPRHSFEAAARDLATFRGLWPGVVESIITTRHPLVDAAAVLTHPIRGIKSVIALV